MTKHLPGLVFALLTLVALGAEADAAQASRCTRDNDNLVPQFTTVHSDRHLGSR